MIVSLNKQYFSSNKRKHKSFLSSQHLLSLHFSFLPSEKIFVFSFICMNSPYQTSPKKKKVKVLPQFIKNISSPKIKNKSTNTMFAII